MPSLSGAAARRASQQPTLAQATGGKRGLIGAGKRRGGGMNVAKGLSTGTTGTPRAGGGGGGPMFRPRVQTGGGFQTPAPTMAPPLPPPPGSMQLGGPSLGGMTRNPTLMQMLQNRMGGGMRQAGGMIPPGFGGGQMQAFKNFQQANGGMQTPRMGGLLMPAPGGNVPGGGFGTPRAPGGYGGPMFGQFNRMNFGGGFQTPMQAPQTPAISDDGGMMPPGGF